jgi:hypothetical protein
VGDLERWAGRADERTGPAGPAIAAPAPQTVDLHTASGPIRCAVVAWGSADVHLRPTASLVDWLPHLTPGTGVVATWLAGSDKAFEAELSVAGRADGGIVRMVLGEVTPRRRRDGRRHLVSWPVQLADLDGEHPRVIVAETLDVSAQGLGVRSIGLVADATLAVALGLPCGHTVLGLAAVQAVGHSAERAGLRFVVLSDADESRLVQALFAVERERARRA